MRETVSGLKTSCALDRLSAFEKHQSWHAHDLVIEGDLGIVIDIQLEYLDLAIPFIRELFDDRVQHLAWLAPNRGKVHQHR